MLFGGSGNLGAASGACLRRAGHSVNVMPWRRARRWLTRPGDEEIVECLAPPAAQGLDIVFANGLIDPSSPQRSLHESNCLFPTRVIKATRHLTGIRWLTFGTVLECFDDLVANNAYVASKRALAEGVKQMASEELTGRLVHMRLHTLYGGAALAPHMFLGGLIEALRNNHQFAMSSGAQLREYHHVDDVAHSIAHLLARPFPEDPTLTLSTGRPMPLAELARSVFSALDRQGDLQVGGLQTPPNENLNVTFEPSPGWLLGSPRDQVAGVCDWVRRCAK